jgi:hypothetical protein
VSHGLILNDVEAFNSVINVIVSLHAVGSRARV